MRFAEGPPKQPTVAFLAVLCEVLQSPHLVAPASPWTPKHPAQLQLHLPSFTLTGLIGILQSCTNFSTDPSLEAIHINHSTHRMALPPDPLATSWPFFRRPTLPRPSRRGGVGRLGGRFQCRLGYRTLPGNEERYPTGKRKIIDSKVPAFGWDM